LDEERLKAEIWPRFSRVLARQEIYLANHSLGRPPDRMADDVRSAIDDLPLEFHGALEHVAVVVNNQQIRFSHGVYWYSIECDFASSVDDPIPQRNTRLVTNGRSTTSAQLCRQISTSQVAMGQRIGRLAKAEDGS